MRTTLRVLLASAMFMSVDMAAAGDLLKDLVRLEKINATAAAAGDSCPCAALGTWCQYADDTAPCPRVNVCHGTTTPCDCNSCPTTASACSGCKPSPPPPPPPTPTPGKYCMHALDCDDDETCCLCNCNYGDGALGTFGCACNDKGKPKPNKDQPHCCGGQFGFEAWCAKAGTSSVKAPMCNDTKTPFGVPTPAENFYKYGQHHRCVKKSIGCNAGYCDNPQTPAADRGVCTRL